MLATYVNDLNPVILEITDSIKLRWYGLAYLLAFMAGYLLLKWMGDRKLWVLPGQVAGDFIAYTAFFGVFLGGRIGNVLIYQRAEFLSDPLMVFRVWEGGMASHGGLAGVMLFTLFYARRHKVSWTGIGDGISVVAPLGLMFGRLANFINGELYGRVDRTYAWAMKFPNALWDRDMEEYQSREQALHAALEADEQGIYAQYRDQLYTLESQIRSGRIVEGTEAYNDYLKLASKHLDMLKEGIHENDVVRDAVAQYLEPRYPSQLFQAALEGLLLFLILFALRLKFPKLANGVLTGVFFIFYAIFRITAENFREPEIDNINILGMEVTMGQFLSGFMVFIGIGFIIRAKLAVKNGTLFRCED